MREFWTQFVGIIEVKEFLQSQLRKFPLPAVKQETTAHSLCQCVNVNVSGPNLFGGKCLWDACGEQPYCPLPEVYI